MTVTLHGDSGEITTEQRSGEESAQIIHDAQAVDIRLLELEDDDFLVQSCTYVIAAYQDDLICFDLEACGPDPCYEYVGVE